MLGWENSKHVNSDVFDLTSVFFRHNKFCNIIAIIGISAINYCILQFSTICILHRFYCNYRYAIFYWSSLAMIIFTVSFYWYKFVLARTNTLDQDIIDDLKYMLEDMGSDITKFEEPEHVNCPGSSTYDSKRPFKFVDFS